MLPATLLIPIAVPEVSQAVGKMSVLNMVLSSSPVVQFTLLLLIFFSVTSWAIIFLKYRQIQKAKKSSEKFLSSFESTLSVEEFLTKPTPQEGNPLYNIFSAGMGEILRAKQARAQNPNAKLTLSLESTQRVIRRAQSQQVQELEQLTPFLATTASAAPFIGLFGTVWGILSAFFVIGEQKSTSLAVVGPYIAEALVATAVGLAAAIPAVIAYNFFVVRIKRIAKDLFDFSLDLEQRIAREYF